MIELNHLTKRYGNTLAVNDISFSIKEGTTVGFLGRNGAGKSTTMNMLTGYTAITEGKISVDGIDILASPIQARKKIGYLPEQPPVYMDMTVKEYLTFVCELKQVPSKQLQSETDYLMGALDIRDMQNRLIRNLSKGYRQRVGIAQAIAGSPPYVILDEPTAGLDPVQIAEIRALIRKLRKKQTIILSSHILSEVEDVCDRVLIIHKGQLLADVAMAELQSSEYKIHVQLAAPSSIVGTYLSAISGVKRVIPTASKNDQISDFTIIPHEKADPRAEIVKLSVQKNWPLLELRPVKMDLEQFFLDVIEKKERADN